MVKIKLGNMVLTLNKIRETLDMNHKDEIPADFRVMANRFISLTHQEAIAWNNLPVQDRALVADVEIQVAIDKVEHLPPFLPSIGAKLLTVIYKGEIKEPESEALKALQKLKKNKKR